MHAERFYCYECEINFAIIPSNIKHITSQTKPGIHTHTHTHTHRIIRILLLSFASIYKIMKKNATPKKNTKENEHNKWNIFQVLNEN